MRNTTELDYDASVDNSLAYIDQASFLGLRALGQSTLVQCTWIYERPIDIDGLRRFHHNLRHGCLARRIERSPLPFGRHRWVSCRESSDVEIHGSARPRADVTAWVDERAQLPIDPEWGPGWHLGVLPLGNGGTAVSLVASHCVTDGVGLSLAIADAANGGMRDLGYPPPRSRTRTRALFEDARQTARAAPEVARACVATAKVARRARRDISRSGRSRSTSTPRPHGDHRVVVPAATVYIDLAAWDDRAKALGGTSNSLFAGCASKLGQRLGRVRPGDGAVTLAIPVSERTDDDTRANALSSVTVTADPTLATTDLRQIRSNIKHALVGSQEIRNELLATLALTPMVPKSLARRLAVVALGSADLPIGCSNLGELDPAVNRPDGTDADYVSIRLVEQGVKRNSLDRMAGQLFLASGRIHGKIFITVAAYQVGGKNSNNDLTELVSRALAEFELTGAIE